MLTTLLDNFNRADGAVGANWTQVPGSTASLVVASNKVAGASNGGGRDSAYWNVSKPAADCAVAVALGVTPAGAGYDCAILIRESADGSTHLGMNFDSAASGQLTFSATENSNSLPLGAPYQANINGFVAGDKVMAVVLRDQLSGWYSQAGGPWKLAQTWTVSKTSQDYAGLSFGFTANISFDDFSLIDLTDQRYVSTLLPKIVRVQRPKLITA